MADEFEIESEGDHEYLVRVHGRAEDAETWVRVTPGLLEQLGLAETDEPAVVRRTIEYLCRYQDAADFPAVVELEDVLASYPQFRTAVVS
jgi:hypothetical protein